MFETALISDKKPALSFRNMRLGALSLLLSLAHFAGMLLLGWAQPKWLHTDGEYIAANVVLLIPVVSAWVVALLALKKDSRLPLGILAFTVSSSLCVFYALFALVD